MTGIPWDNVALTVITSVLSILVGWLLSAVKQQAHRADEERDALYAGVRALLRTELTEAHTLYVDRGAEMTLYQRENIVAIHAAYNALGGNDIGDKQYQELMGTGGRSNR